jgi:SAM-dependent methyltransferase
MSWRSRQSYDEWARRSAGVREARQAAELADIPRNDPFWLPGYCVVCGEERSFVTSASSSTQTLPDGRRVPNWREHLVCEGCRFNDRQRASFHLLRQEVRPATTARIYVTEVLTDYVSRLSEEYPDTIGSEYMGPGHEPGELVDGIRHEDLQALSFGDASLDVILSFDVLEHVPDERRSFREMARTLRPGGTLLMTAPTRIDRDDNEVRAILTPSGEIEHLLEPEYHGNPVDPEAGSLSFRAFGWQILDQLREAGFRDAAMLTYWSGRCKYYGEPQLAIRAVR